VVDTPLNTNFTAPLLNEPEFSHFEQCQAESLCICNFIVCAEFVNMLIINLVIVCLFSVPLLICFLATIE